MKHHLKFACITLCGMSLAASLALSAPKNTQPPLHTRIADYLENKVVGKTLHFHTTGRMAEGRIEFVFDRYVTYTSLARTQNGLRFDEVIAIKQANYDVVDGQRTGTPTIKDRSLVKSCELGERASTGNVVGFCRYVSSTLEDLTGTAEALTASLDDETLVLHEDSVNYLDFYAPSNTFEPGVVKTDSAFSLVKGKLKRLQTATSYRLDPNSLQRLDDSRSVQEYVDLQD